MENDAQKPRWPTRAEGLRRLEVFVPRAGRDYASTRNFDFGPEIRSNVSTLSPYTRFRLVLESEIVAAVLERFAFSTAEKFLQEVCWRTYWKGWLELRPSVWRDYRADVAGQLEALEDDSSLRERYELAVSGRTGIACFDAWARELVDFGYLHNHTRMWFASLWIFTLGLPWSLGADFFLRHLIDGDPASNTLSWRWVAGLQTRGKTYAATAENIARYTEGRFRPTEPFARYPDPVEGPPLPKAGRLRPRERPESVASGLLLLEDDLEPSSLELHDAKVVGVAALAAPGDRSPLGVASQVQRFTDEALADTLARASLAFSAGAERLPGDEWPTQVVAWADRLGVRQVVVPEPPVGPAAERLVGVATALQQRGVRLVPIRRDWDDLLWPYATAGFFPFKSKLPETFARLGLMDRPARGSRARP